MTTLLPKDADNNVIPALRFADGKSHGILATASAARNTNAFNGETRVVSLYATVPVYIAFGNQTVIATNADHYFPAGVYYDAAIAGGTGKGPHDGYISVLRAGSADGVVYVSEKQ